jgi:hypothetical protein
MLTLILILSLFSSSLLAPVRPVLYIERSEAINPYEAIWQATCKVESNFNPLAYHFEKNGFASVGIAQVQISRIIDFNARTGLNYTLMDMYIPNKAKVVFMHYAIENNPNDIERICRLWNGGNKGMEKESTKKYYLKIQKALNDRIRY